MMDESISYEMKNVEESTDSISAYNGLDERLGLNSESARDFLGQHSWPEGLQTTLINNLRAIPIRFFIIDNSGSMIIHDGNRVGVNGTKKVCIYNCMYV